MRLHVGVVVPPMIARPSSVLCRYDTRPAFALADPKTDFVFKRIFGTAEHKSLLIALLNHILELEGKRRILDLQHLSGDQHVAIPELKLSIVDVKCTDASGHGGAGSAHGVLGLHGGDAVGARNARREVVTV